MALTKEMFARGQRVRIVEQPKSISARRAGREGEYLGPHFVEEGLVYVALDSGDHRVPASQVLLRPADLEAVEDARNLR